MISPKTLAKRDRFLPSLQLSKMGLPKKGMDRLPSTHFWVRTVSFREGIKYQVGLPIKVKYVEMKTEFWDFYSPKKNKHVKSHASVGQMVPSSRIFVSLSRR